MEERLDEMPDCGMEDEPVAHIKIAKTTLAFANGPMIDMLRSRGAAIKAEQWDKQAEIEKNINSYKNEHVETLTTPCSIFMTFENEEGVTRALNYDDAIEADQAQLGHLKKWIGEFEIEIQPASEPSDIIWENRQYTPRQRRGKECVVFLVMLVMLLASFVVIFLLSSYSNAMLNKYPIVTCNDLAGYPDADTMEKFAILEYNTNTALEAKGKTVSYGGYVQCFCQDQAKAEVSPDATYGDADQAICEDYISSAFTTLVATNSVTIIIVVINLILKYATIALVTWIKYDTHSEQMTKITNGVFYALYFNTAILILLVYANLEEVAPPLGSIFSGPFYDYSPGWYAIVGNTLTGTMLLNAFMPPIYEF